MADPKADEQSQSDFSSSSETLKPVIENEDLRLSKAIAQRDELQARLEKLEADSKAAKDADLLEQNKFQELYEQEKAKNDGLQSIQEQAKLYSDALQATNQSRIERIPPKMQHRIPQFTNPIEMGKWLDANSDLFGIQQKPAAPNLDGGAGSSSGTSPSAKLSATEIEYANAAGIPLETYAAMKANKGQPLNLDKKT